MRKEPVSFRLSSHASSENDLNAPGWVNTGFAVVGTSAHSTIDIVVVESEQRFFRILRLP